MDNPPQSLGRAIRDLRKERGLTQEEAGRSVGLTQVGQSKRELGIIAVKPSELEQYAKLFGVSVQSIVDRTDPTAAYRIPILNRGKGGVLIDYEREPLWLGEDEIEAIDPSPAAYRFAVQIISRSMDPTLQIGDLVVFAPTSKPPPGAICLVGWRPGGQERCAIGRYAAEQDAIRLTTNDGAAFVIAKDEITRLAVALERRVPIRPAPMQPPAS